MQQARHNNAVASQYPEACRSPMQPLAWLTLQTKTFLLVDKHLCMSQTTYCTGGATGVKTTSDQREAERVMQCSPLPTTAPKFSLWTGRFSRSVTLDMRTG